MNLFKNFNIALNQAKIELLCRVGIILVVLLYAIHFFDEALAIGLFSLIILSSATIFLLYGFGVRDKNIYIVFLIGLLVHLGATLFLYWTGFKPFGGGGDFTLYNNIAIQIAQRFSHRNFSLAGLYTEHFFPILIGVIYMVTFSDMIVGQLFTVWLAAISIVLAYVIVLQIGGTKKIAFGGSLMVSVYPSYLYFGSVLLKDTVVIPLVLAGMLLSIKMCKNFSWVKFLLFFVILTCLINLRFYVGYALMFALIGSSPLLSAYTIKKRIIYWLIIIFFIGFSPQMVGDGYYGFNNFKKFLNPKQITYFREVIYANPPSKPSVPAVTIPKPSAPLPSVSTPLSPISPPESNNGNGSTFVLETGFHGGITTFLKNYSQSFIYSLLGPLPWQFRNQRQIVGLAETIPWYVLIIVSFYGCARFIKKRGMVEFFKYYRMSFPLLLFSVFTLGALSLFINNYGIIARIRIPVFICFLSMMFVSFNNDIEKFYEKISHYWGRGIHRLSFIKSTFGPRK